jgi:hypothetical protein
MEDVHMNVFYMSTQSKLKDSSPIFSYVKKNEYSTKKFTKNEVLVFGKQNLACLIKTM